MEIPALQIRNIVIEYDNGFRLDIPYMEFKEGYVYGLVGPNGAGKTTLLNQLSLLDELTNGEIIFKGEKVTPSNLLNIRRRITMIMENPYLFHTTVYKNITSGLKCRSVDKKLQLEIVEEVLKKVGLEGFENRYAPDLSGGERQRVAIARALAIKPEILFLDEPFSNIDRGNINLIENLIRTIQKDDHTTIIFSTHDISQAYHLSNYVISLVDGKIIDSSLENLFKGTVEDDNGMQIVRISPDVSITVVTEISGDTYICIPPQDIILSQKQIESSARNSFKGIIRKIHLEEQTVKVYTSLDKKVEFISLITKKSCEKMKLSIGSNVFVTFKTTSVKVF